jgi:Right handed beta helix region
LHGDDAGEEGMNRLLLVWVLVMGGHSLSAAATYVVDAAAGHDASPGTARQPFRSIAKAAQVAVSPGDRVIVRRGLYPDPVQVAGAGTPEAPITFVSEPLGAAVISGWVQPAHWLGDHDDRAAATQNHDVTWRGFTFTGGVSLFQLRAGEGWIIEDAVFGGRGINGLNIRAHRVTVRRSRFEDLHQHAIVASGGRDVVIRQNTIQRINAAGAADPANSAVTKFIGTERLLVEGNTSQDNVGAGLWLDYQNRHYRIRHNRIRRNRGRTEIWQGPGMWIELSPGPGVIADNTLEDNTGAGIGMLESPGVTVQRNTIQGGYACIEVRNLPRGRDFTIRDALITDNTCRAAGSGIRSSVGDWVGFNIQAAKVTVDKNHYDLPATSPVADWLGVQTFTRSETCERLSWECTP